MRLNLREIINIPGGEVRFDYEPDLSDTAIGSVKEVLLPARTRGSIKNAAGVLEFNASVEADALCICARCLKEFTRHVHIHIDAVIKDGEEADDDSPDVYYLDGDYIDVDEVIVTEFILSMEQRLLCRDDCKGLCERCGADLNDGPCSCKKEIDPRLAVLGQLLENE